VVVGQEQSRSSHHSVPDGLDLLEVMACREILERRGEQMEVRDDLLGRMRLAKCGKAHDVGEEDGYVLMPPRRDALRALKLSDRGRRQYGVEKPRGAPPLLIDLREVRRLAIVQPLPLETGADSRFEKHWLEGLGQVVLGAARNAAGRAFQVRQGRDHDYRNMPPCLLRPHALEQTVAVEPGHHDIEQGKIEPFDLEPLQRFLAVCGPYAHVPQEFEFLLEDVKVERFIVDDENAGLIHWPPTMRANLSLPIQTSHSRKPPAQGREQKLFVDWLGQEVVAARRLRLFLIAAHGMSRERNDRDTRGAWVRLDPSSRLPPVNYGERQIHQNEIGSFGCRFGNACGAIVCKHNRVIFVKNLHQHVAVEPHILNDDDLFHSVPSPIAIWKSGASAAHLQLGGRQADGGCARFALLSLPSRLPISWRVNRRPTVPLLRPQATPAGAPGSAPRGRGPVSR